MKQRKKILSSINLVVKGPVPKEVKQILKEKPKRSSPSQLLRSSGNKRRVTHDRNAYNDGQHLEE